MADKQRLVVCLDGTWNNRDDSTNVLHHFNLLARGKFTDSEGNTLDQKKHYHLGVGTGVLDGITGGAFGFGLEQNVRDAYNWLVSEFRSDESGKEADEIYLFGFSRGAYTARSLVGLIGRCGLLRRGAPLTVKQLWAAYCILGREHEQRSSPWDLIFTGDDRPMRQLSELVRDPWDIDARETPLPGEVPGQRIRDLNEMEKLLVRWSRRVRITYLGLYDTVGAMGFDALAIPGLKSKLALHHNMRASTLIQHCRHALALDEFRTSFSHTPFLEYVGHAADPQEPGTEPVATLEATQTHWKRTSAMWRRKIEQRWFVGAHSNIGGGYSDNELARFPFRWVFDGALELGLKSEELPNIGFVTSQVPCDSYSNFAKPFWTMIFRSKRYYRIIDPQPDLNAGAPKESQPKAEKVGFTLKSINEQVDSSVFDHWRKAELEDGPTPNLVEYGGRAVNPESSEAAQWTSILAKKSCHPWLGDSLLHYAVLVVWATIAAAGLSAVYEVMWAEPGTLPPAPVLWLIAGLLVFVDWRESRSNFLLALSPYGPGSPRRRAFLASIYWTRALGVTLFSIGFFAALGHLWNLGWKAELTRQTWIRVRADLEPWLMVLLFAGGALLLVGLFEGGRTKKRRKAVLLGMLAGTLAAPVIAGMVMVLASLCNLFLPSHSHTPPSPPAADAPFAGLLLLVQLGIVYLLNAFVWAAEPFRKANLGRILQLQLCGTPAQVKARFENWRQMLACRWLAEDPTTGPSAKKVREIVRESLWRDIIGLIPVYLLVLGFGLWFAATRLEWNWLKIEILGIPLWILILLIALVADYLEDAFHLRYVALHAQGQTPSTPAILFCYVMTLLKFLTCGAAFLLTFAAVADGSWRLLFQDMNSGWRGAIVLFLSIGSLAVGLLIGAAALASKIWHPKPLGPGPPPGGASDRT